jgi:hypothetical protein
VRDFEGSVDDRWLAWQDLEITNGEEEWPAGAVYVRDRTTGTNTYLADAQLGATLGVLAYVEFGVIRLRLGSLFDDPERYWFWPSMSTVDLPPGLQVRARLDDGRWLVSEIFGGSHALLDMATGDMQPLFDGPGNAFVRQGGIEVVEGSPSNFTSDDFARHQGKLWFVPWDGERELLAQRVTYSYGLFPDGRLLTTIDVDEDRLGSMIVVEPETLEEQLLAHHALTSWKTIDEDGEVVYAVTDGDRSGVWLTKPAR